MVRPPGTPSAEPVPDGPPDGRWRRSAKALLLDATGRLLLLRMHDPVDPDLGQWWELPGGGLEPGEAAEQACARELGEETGYAVPPGAVSPARWTRRATFRWLGTRRWQEETVHVVRLAPDAVAAPPRPTDEETAAVLELRWWRVEELGSAALPLYPGRLAELAPLVLAGRPVREPLERWS